MELLRTDRSPSSPCIAERGGDRGVRREGIKLNLGQRAGGKVLF